MFTLKVGRAGLPLMVSVFLCLMAEFLFNENGYNDLKLVYKSFVSMTQSVIMLKKQTDLLFLFIYAL